jgi:hypothetical protein
MNDNLKFRAKIAGTNEWVFGLPHSVYGEGIDSIQSKFGNIEYIKTDTISQFTGVIDVEGNEIYGRDILEVLSIDSEEGKEVLKTLEIYFDEELCSFEFRNDWEPFSRQYGNDFKILGNIFDNPELINGAVETVA